MKRSTVVRLAGAGVVAFVAARRCRRRPPRAHPFVVIPFVALWQLLRPPTIEFQFPADSVLGFLEDAFGGVLGLVGFAIDKLEDALRAVWGDLAQTLQGIYTGLLGVIGQISAGFSSISDWIRAVAQGAEDLFLQVWDTLGGFVENALNVAIAAGGVIWHFLYDNINAAIENILGTFDEFWGTVTNLVGQLIQDAFAGAGWLWDWLVSNVTQIVTSLIGTGAWLWNMLSGFAYDWLFAVLHETESLWDWVRENVVQPLIDAAIAGLGDLLSILYGAWDFLVWVAEHPLDWFTSQFDGVFADGASAFLDRMGSAIDDNQDAAESFLDRIFG